MSKLGIAGTIAQSFIRSKLTPLLVIAAFALGAFTLLEIPREEEPQIIVPMIDIFVQFPGASAKEVEERVSAPVEQMLRDIPGVEYVYSTSQPGMSMVTARFYVGQKLLRGLRVRATDADWTAGDGPEVAGPIQALVLTLSGRMVALDELDGDGLATLRRRVAT